MKKYDVLVNGNKYEVEIEEVGGAPVVNAAPANVAPAAPAAVAPVASAPAAAEEKPAAAQGAGTPSAGAAIAEAPMPGTVIDIKESVGQHVSEGDTVAILEAMKMENEIPAPKSGTVDAIISPKGTQVNSGDGLVSVR
jgi:biotin carboxyl carrier protein